MNRCARRTTGAKPAVAGRPTFKKESNRWQWAPWCTGPEKRTARAFWRAMTGPRRSDTKTFRLEPKTQLQDRTCVPSEEQAFNRRLRDLVGIERREHLPVLDDRAHVGNILLNETDDAVAEGLAQLVPGVFPQRVRRVLQKNTRDGEPRRRREAACVCFIITAMASHPPTPESNRSSERSDSVGVCPGG